ncbi:aspartate carbamoyltransferase [Patescibacteria group bacterium]|nr:aspartate carbamoyltransferase [Patescibacteria group bacterium]
MSSRLEETFYQQDFVSVNQIQDRETVDELFESAYEMEERVAAREVGDVLAGHAIPIIFYQPSTRTALSFLYAAKRLGAYSEAMHDMTFSSAAKGESLPDSIRAIQNVTGASAIVLRHPDDASSQEAANYAEVPIINAGSGKREHPTQALLDLLTIHAKKQTFDNLKVALVGDLLYGRTVKSLALLLSRIGHNNQFYFASAPQLRFPEDFLATLPNGTRFTEMDNIHDALDADVLYMTRTQKEWFEQEGRLDEYEELKAKLVLTNDMAEMMPQDAIIMHPLPRQEELRYGVDKNPRAAYFDQMKYGLYLRMAILKAILVPGS